MNRLVIVVLSIAMASLTACQPTMTIRQTQPGKSNGGEQLAIEISPVNKSAGSHVYTAKTKLTNFSKSSMTIKGCELAARNMTYQSRPGGHEFYQFELAPGASVYFGPSFSLNDPVQDVFEDPAELRVHYVVDGRKELARAVLRGEPYRPSKTE